jgi:hypothetical protein
VRHGHGFAWPCERLSALPTCPPKAASMAPSRILHFRFTNSETIMLTIHQSQRATFRLTFCFTFSLTHSLTHLLIHSLTYSFTHLFTLLTVFLKASCARRKRKQYQKLRQRARFHERPESQKKSMSRGDATTSRVMSPTSLEAMHEQSFRKRPKKHSANRQSALPDLRRGYMAFGTSVFPHTCVADAKNGNAAAASSTRPWVAAEPREWPPNFVEYTQCAPNE